MGLPAESQGGLILVMLQDGGIADRPGDVPRGCRKRVELEDWAILFHIVPCCWLVGLYICQWLHMFHISAGDTSRYLKKDTWLLWAWFVAEHGCLVARPHGPGPRPDVFHTFFGLAGLSLMRSGLSMRDELSHIYIYKYVYYIYYIIY